jgi:hypothetical protein
VLDLIVLDTALRTAPAGATALRMRRAGGDDGLIASTEDALRAAGARPPPPPGPAGPGRPVPGRPPNGGLRHETPPGGGRD